MRASTWSRSGAGLGSGLSLGLGLGLGSGLEVPGGAAEKDVHDVDSGVLHDIPQNVLGGKVGGEDASVSAKLLLSCHRGELAQEIDFGHHALRSKGGNLVSSAETGGRSKGLWDRGTMVR